MDNHHHRRKPGCTHETSTSKPPLKNLPEKIGGKTVSYTILVAEQKKNSAEEPDVLEFSSLAELKKLRRRCPETMSCTYFYALSSGVDKQFRHIHVAEADHYKQFVRQTERAGIDI
ncbi:hypothetical protein ABN106_18745 [Enterobacter hormaechei]